MHSLHSRGNELRQQTLNNIEEDVMDEVKKVQQDEEITFEDLQTVRNQLKAIDEKLGRALPVPKLQRLHLLDGLIQRDKYERIERRLDQNSAQKENLAKYLTDALMQELAEPSERKARRIFIESGSTLAYFSAALASALRETVPACVPTIVTNNFLTLTTFGVGRVEAISGSLEADYLAFLPFRNAHRKARVTADPSIGSSGSITEQDRIWDANAYRSLEATIASIDTIYLTASGFGFLLGPHVGSRANAIFKYCLLNNRARRKLRLCIAHSKVHYEKGWADRKDVEEHVYNLCYTIFYLGSKLKYPDPLDQLSDVTVLSGEKRDSLPSKSETPGDPRSAPAEIGLSMLEHRSELCEGYGLTGLQGTWKSLLMEYRPGSLEIIIGIHHPSRPLALKNKLRDAYKEANKVLKTSVREQGWGLNREYQEKPGTEEDMRALHLVLVEAFS